MPGEGLEPSRPARGHLILSQARMTSFATPAGEAYSRRALLAGRHLREREPLRALAAERVAEGLERLLVEAVADRDVALAPVALALVAGRVARPRGQRDLRAERRVRRGEDPVRALLPEAAELVLRRGRDLRAVPDDHAAVLLVVDDD